MENRLKQNKIIKAAIIFIGLMIVFSLLLFTSFFFKKQDTSSIDINAGKIAALRCQVEQLKKHLTNRDTSEIQLIKRLESLADNLYYETEKCCTTDSEKKNFEETLFISMYACNTGK